MASNYKQDGKIITFTATGAFTQDTIYAATDVAGVNLETGVTGDLQPVAFCGVFTGLTKTAGTGEAQTIGQALYATSTGAITTTAGSNAVLGWAVETAVTGATTGSVNLAPAVG
jgi:predicted RecA/RadA family phage recombinase